MPHSNLFPMSTLKLISLIFFIILKTSAAFAQDVTPTRYIDTRLPPQFVEVQLKLIGQPDKIREIAFNDTDGDSQFFTDTVLQRPFKRTINRLLFRNFQLTKDIPIVIPISLDPEVSLQGNGSIIANIGILEAIETEDELAFLVAHELSHFLLSHEDEDAYRGRRAQTYETIGGLFLLGALASGGGSGIGMTEALAGIFADDTSRGMMKNAFASEWNGPKYIPKNELEADLIAIDLMTKAGYSPSAALTMLDAVSNNAFQKQFKSTHPDPNQRFQAALQYIETVYPIELDTRNLTPASWKQRKNAEITSVFFQATLILEQALYGEYDKAVANANTFSSQCVTTDDPAITAIASLAVTNSQKIYNCFKRLEDNTKTSLFFAFSYAGFLNKINKKSELKSVLRKLTQQHPNSSVYRLAAEHSYLAGQFAESDYYLSLCNSKVRSGWPNWMSRNEIESLVRDSCTLRV